MEQMTGVHNVIHVSLISTLMSRDSFEVSMDFSDAWSRVWSSLA